MSAVIQHGPRMQSLNIREGVYPDMTVLSVRKVTAEQRGDICSPSDRGVEHEDTDFPVRWLRKRTEGYGSVPLAAGLLLMKPCVLDFTFVGDETILLVSGSIDIVDDQGHIARLRTGDMAYFAAGTATTWTVLEESLELFTILG
jgi:uncharacterized cupin superfamily protein